MARADLHVHSKYSEHPSEWFLKRIGARESYTDPETIYELAKQRGMDFVTITDHNRIEGSLLLNSKYPDDTFTGAEFTTYFPEDGCKIHLLVYGLDQDEFEDIQGIRQDIYQLRSYLHERKLAHSIAHATYLVNGMLTVEHLEKLILLFGVFEGINGGRNKVNNRSWTRALSNLDSDGIRRLEAKHGIRSPQAQPWRKGLTAGSDDHAGLFVGQTYTEAHASTPRGFLQAIREKGTVPWGRSNNYQSLVFTVYKIAYEFSRQKRTRASRDFITALTEFIFEKRDFKLKEKLFLRKLSSSGGSRARLYKLVNRLIEDLRKQRDGEIEEKLEIVYSRIADLSDEFMRSFVGAVKKDIASGDFVGFVTNSSTSIPGVFLSLPFFTAVRDMFSNKYLLDEVNNAFLPPGDSIRDRRVMWFTDTLTDLNGVSVTLNKIAGMASETNPNVRLVTALSEDERKDVPEDNVVCLPYIDSFNLPGYEKYLLKVPSILKALDIVARYEPDEIYISTPGPVGLTGLLVAKLMSISATGFFHTDYSRQVIRIVSDKSLNGIIESYIKWFYSCCNEIRVPTDEYIGILCNRGYDADRMVKFRRGIDTTEFAPRETARELRQSADSAPVLMYTGRISRDKSLDVAFEAFREILRHRPKATFLIAGDGPYMFELQRKYDEVSGMRFIGRIPNRELPELYSAADLFVFPSETDTFGMSVLEAQACGLPAVVSSVGGPREIIEEGRTGFIATAGDITHWTETIEAFLDMMDEDPSAYEDMRDASRRRVLRHYDWKQVYRTLFGRTDPAIVPEGTDEQVRIETVSSPFEKEPAEIVQDTAEPDIQYQHVLKSLLEKTACYLSD